MKTSNVALLVLIAFVIGFILGMTIQRKYRPCADLQVVTIQRDTVTVRDTVNLPIPQPQKQQAVRRDTVKLRISAVGNDSTRVDTVAPSNTKSDDSGLGVTPEGDIVVDIERKTYQTDEYKAVIEGWRPNLLLMEVYPKTVTITKTVKETQVKAPNWAVTVGPGFGYDGSKVIPYVGLTAGFVLWSK